MAGPTNRWAWPTVLALLVAAMVAAPAVPAAPAAPGGRVSSAGDLTGMVRGRVVVKGSGRTVAGATIALPQYGMTTRSLGDGTFHFAPIPTEDPYRRIQAVVTARGWGRWSIRGVPLYPNDTLILNVELRRQPFVDSVLSPRERAREQQSLPRAPASTYDHTCTGWKGGQVPPDTISVYITEDNAATRYDFDFYVRHVLPKEWIPSWDEDSLGAGAIAVKDYGWYRAKPNHAYSGGDGCADVVDTVADQVFDPAVEYDDTNQAVWATLGSVFWKDGGIFLSQYYAGAPDDPCAPVEGQYAGRMSQWGTQTCALDSVLWPDIVEVFYDDKGDTEWKDKKNLLLNPGVENSQMYPWLVGSQGGTSITRVKGDAYKGNWYLSVTASHTARVYQDRPFLGGSKTDYHFEAALRCGKENAKDCTVTLKVIAIADDGTEVSNSKDVTENNDGTWRLYTYDPPASGMAHVTVEWRIVTEQSVGLDAAKLTGPYGGP
jgi:hypothetical protein